MIERESLSQRELVMRVATLELLVADLIHLVRQCAPEAMRELAEEAARDVDVQTARDMPCDAETQRFRLRKVLDSRARNLAKTRFSSRLGVQRHAPTD
ncbi:MAG TPA: hypothetical protein VN814_18295 [Caulobacteraceae bacterium]|nr:hypothetical protein [Caulobacteraceae bacterium]